jgi:hypothetical protein
MVRARVRVHLAICDPCARYLRQVSWLGLAARSSVERPEFTVRGVRETRLAEAAKRRLRGRIRGDVRGGPSSP